MSDGLATMADIQSIERIPLVDRDLPPSTYEAIRRGAKINKDNVALQFFLEGPGYNDTIYYTYADLLELITQTANMFHDLGVGRDDVVSMILPNTPQSFFAIWGAQAAGIINPIDPLIEAQDMADMMNAAGTKVLVTLAPFFGVDIWPKVSSIADQVSSLETILRVDLANYLTTFKRYMVRAATLTSDKGGAVRAKVFDFVNTSRRYSSDKLESGRQIRADDIAAYFVTKGISGDWRLVPHTHFNEVAAAWSAASTITVTPDKRFFCGSPLFQVDGAIISGLIPWMHGASIILGTPQGFRATMSHIWEILEYYEVNFFSGVPEIFNAMLEVPAEGRDSSLEFVFCGSGPMSSEVINQFTKQTGARFLEGYMLTEGSGIVAVNPFAGEKRTGSLGFRLPYLEMKVAQLGSGGGYQGDCPVDELGTIIMRGPNVFPGYLDQSLNQSAWVDTGDGGGAWFKTGDQGRQDAAGYFWLVDDERMAADE